VKASRHVALLDVNVLIALFDPDHVHHDTAHDWFADHRALGWATCPLTENGFLRAASRAARTRHPVAIATLVQALRTFTASGQHEFWNDDVTLLDERQFNPEAARGHQQFTDIYLLALAVRRKGTLVTFDRSVPLVAVKNARSEHLSILAPGT